MNTFRGARDTVQILGNLYKKSYDLSVIIADMFSAKVKTNDYLNQQQDAVKPIIFNLNFFKS